LSEIFSWVVEIRMLMLAVADGGVRLILAHSSKFLVFSERVCSSLITEKPHLLWNLPWYLVVSAFHLSWGPVARLMGLWASHGHWLSPTKRLKEVGECKKGK
jgi:hypothetical protein